MRIKQGGKLYREGDGDETSKQTIISEVCAGEEGCVLRIEPGKPKHENFQSKELSCRCHNSIS